MNLWRKVILGTVTCNNFVSMTSEQMASEELSNWRQKSIDDDLTLIQVCYFICFFLYINWRQISIDDDLTLIQVFILLINSILINLNLLEAEIN